MIYLNSTDRRPGAPLKTPRQIDDARSATVATLLEAKHPETGVPLFPKVISTADAYDLDPAVEGYPDLIATPDEPYWVRCKLAKGRDWIEADPQMPGTHRPDGVFALSGDGVVPGRAGRANLRDIAPTILRWFGLPIPDHVQGEPLACLGLMATLDREYRVDSATSALHGHHAPAFDYTPEEAAMIEQRLADLGYLE